MQETDHKTLINLGTSSYIDYTKILKIKNILIFFQKNSVFSKEIRCKISNFFVRKRFEKRGLNQLGSDVFADTRCKLSL